MAETVFFCLAAAGVGDGLPSLVVDGFDGCFDVGELGRCDRIRRVMTRQGVEHLIGEETRVGAHTQFHVPALRGASDPAWRLCREPLMTALRRTLTHPPMQDLAAVCARRDQRVIAQHLAIAISRALLSLPQTSHTVESKSTVNPPPAAAPRPATRPEPTPALEPCQTGAHAPT